jgi:hypothetical protein
MGEKRLSWLGGCGRRLRVDVVVSQFLGGA